MYKVLSICLAFSLVMSEITTVKQNTVVDVTKDQANIKKPKSGEPIELNIFNTKNSNSEKKVRAQKSFKKIKQKHDRSRRGFKSIIYIREQHRSTKQRR